MKILEKSLFSIAVLIIESMDLEVLMNILIKNISLIS